MKRILVAFLIAGSVIGISGQGSISITNIDRPSAGTFASITINGNGFDTHAAISVVFTTRDGITMTVPATLATASSVRVVVPPFINSVNGNLFDTSVVADVQVVQVTSSAVMTSNTLGGFTVEPTPQVTTPPGAYTKALLQTIIDIQADVRTARQSTAGFGDVVTASQTFADAQKPLLDAIDVINKAPDASVNLPAKDDLPLSVSAKSLRVMDRVGRAFVLQANSLYKVSDPGPPRTTSCRCNPIALDSDGALCEFRQNPCAAYDGSRKTTADVAAGLTGAQFSTIGSWMAGGLSSASFVASETAGALGLFAGHTLAYVVAVLSGIDPPGAESMLRDVGAQLIDDLNNLGLAVSVNVTTAVDLTSKTENVVIQTKGRLPASPEGGLVTPAPQPENPPANTRPAKVYSGAIGVGPKWIATPVNQQVTTLTTATLPAPRVARFNGGYAGVGNAICTVQTPEGPVSAGGSGAISATVSNGVVSADGLVGSVTETGRFTAPATGGGGITCTVGGAFWLDERGAAGASGFIRCGGEGVGCAGTWNLQRQQ